MYGVDPETCGWVMSFFCVRTRHVEVDEEASKEIEIISGVPKGLVLGPIFFLIYINGIAKYTKYSPVRLFANNTITYLTLTAENDCKKLQEDIQALERRLTGRWTSILTNALSPE